MIRLRCERGIRVRSRQTEIQAGSDEWIELALICARLQAEFVIEYGRKIVPFSEVRSQTLSYDAGIIELLAWEDHGSGKIRRIRRADLSRLAAQALVEAKLLPRCFVPVLVSHDLLHGDVGTSPEESEILIEEFTAWLGCGGLGAGGRQGLSLCVPSPSVRFGARHNPPQPLGENLMQPLTHQGAMNSKASDCWGTCPPLSASKIPTYTATANMSIRKDGRRLLVQST